MAQLEVFTCGKEKKRAGRVSHKGGCAIPGVILAKANKDDIGHMKHQSNNYVYIGFQGKKSFQRGLFSFVT